MSMDVDEAIRTAIEFETRVRDQYVRAAAAATDPAAKSVLATLAKEEQGHLQYLEHRLEEWRASGKLTAKRLATALPSPERIRDGLARLEARMKPAATPPAGEEQTLRTALGAEQDVGAFYKRMVAELPGEARTMFRRFVEIEEGHLAIVQAELDAVTRLGFWFDTAEFRLEEE
ncbi:MAG: hypothetical protein HY907_02390 [Deltaproteobacteria bacterium]|nr:hypothetical protein [Deltaproteobacteria bacterium]